MQPVIEPYPSIRIVYEYQQNSTLFAGSDVAEFCKEREEEIERRIQNLPHNTIVGSDKETQFTELVNTYLSFDDTDYPRLSIDEATLLSSSNATHVEVLYTIPWTGNVIAFSFKPTEDFGKPSSNATIHLHGAKQEITFYYAFPNGDSTEQLHQKVVDLLKNDVSWVVESLDSVIHQFREHDKRLREIMVRALEQRIRTVVNIQGLMEDVEIPASLFEGKLSVVGARNSSKQRSPRYNVFRPLLFGQQKGQCKGTEREIYFGQSTVDHVVPKSKGGKDELRNLIILCEPCNKLKNDGTWEEYLENIKASPSICQGYKDHSEHNVSEVNK